MTKIISRRWIYLPVEVKSRELFPKLILASIAVQKGFGVFIGRNGMNISRDPFPRGIYFDKCLSIHKEKSHEEQVLAKKNLLVSLDEEGLLMSDEKVYTSRRICHRSLELSSIVFTWGNAQKKIFTSVGQHQNKVILSGSPRIDSWRPKFSATHTETAKAYRAKYGAFILVVSNWGLKKEELASGLDPDGDYDSPRAQRRNKFINLIDSLSNHFPSTNIIVRPHPQDLDKYWRTKQQSFPRNVQVVKIGSIGPWLQAAKIIIHNNCTTGLEAFIGGIPTIAFSPPLRGIDGDFNAYTFPINNLGLICRSDQETIHAINKINNDVDLQPSKIGEKIKNNFVYEEEKSSQLRLLSPIFINSLESFEYKIPDFNIKRRLRAKIGVMKWRIQDLLGKSKYSLPYTRQKNPGIEYSDIYYDLEKISGILGFEQNRITIKKVDADTFCIFLV